jgi:hypothetical protein
MAYKTLSSLFLSLAIAALPAAAWFEKAERKVWESRLLIPELTFEPNRHTPLVIDGTYLPSIIKENTTFTLTQSPLILTKKTRIPQNVSITINPGVNIYTHEFSGIEVEGTLVAAGQADAPIVFFSNEQHPLNQTWNGITFTAGSQGQINYVQIHQSDPAITCSRDSRVTVANSKLNSHSLAAFIASNNCSFTTNLIKSQHDGINVIGAQFDLNNNSFKTKQHTVQQYNLP